MRLLREHYIISIRRHYKFPSIPLDQKRITMRKPVRSINIIYIIIRLTRVSRFGYYNIPGASLAAASQTELFPRDLSTLTRRNNCKPIVIFSDYFYLFLLTDHFISLYIYVLLYIVSHFFDTYLENFPRTTTI